MRRTGWMLVCLCLMLSCAAAEKTVTALAVSFHPENPVCTAVQGRILACDASEKMLTVEWIVPETFDREEILSLNAGDGIYTQGREIRIESVDEVSGCIVFNLGETDFGDGSVWLEDDGNGNYRRADGHAWNTAGICRLPVREHMLFLDEAGPGAWDGACPPAVHTAGEFMDIYAEEEQENGPGFFDSPLWFVFDGNGELAVIRRLSVPGQ